MLTVVSIDFFRFSFMPFLYSGVDFRQQKIPFSNDQNDNFPKDVFWAKRASKIIVLPKEILSSFSIGTFLTNYDVTNRKH